MTAKVKQRERMEEDADLNDWSRQTRKGNKIHTATTSEAPQPTPSKPQPQYGMRHLQGDLTLKLAEAAPTKASCARVERCLAELNKIVRTLGSGWTVRPFGSNANGFAAASSDLDATCCQHGREPQTQSFSAAMLGGQLAPALARHGSFVMQRSILAARVPIVKMRFEDALDVDLSCLNWAPLTNTRLLLAYCFIDTRVRDLGLLVKIWAKGAKVCDASLAGLSSYAFTLLVIYFLLVHPEVRLPHLPVGAFETDDFAKHDALIAGARSAWQCSLSVAELLVRFFQFYAEDFRWGSEVVSVRVGDRYAASNTVFSNLSGRSYSSLHIEDPFELERNLHMSLGESEEQYLYLEMFKASVEISAATTPLPLKPVSGVQALHQSPATYDVVGQDQTQKKRLLKPRHRHLRHNGQQNVISISDTTASEHESSSEVSVTSMEEPSTKKSLDAEPSCVPQSLKGLKVLGSTVVTVAKGRHIDALPPTMCRPR